MGNIHQRSSSVNNSMIDADSSDMLLKRRGISVQSKEKQKRDMNKSAIYKISTESSHHELFVGRNKLGAEEYNSQKI